MDVQVRALRSFQFGKEIKTRHSEPFFISRFEFARLESKGLVEEYTLAPSGAVGTQSSASLAAPVLPQTIASESESGGKRRRRKTVALSSSTPVSE